MPRKAKPVQEVVRDERRRLNMPPEPEPVNLDEVEPTPLSKDEIETQDRLSEFLANFGGKDFKVRVEHFNTEEKVYEHVDTFPIDGFDPYVSLKKFGKGRYRLTFLNERGKYVDGGRAEVRISGLGVEAPKVVNGTVVSPQEDPFKNPMFLMLMENMKSANAQLVAMVTAAFSKPEPTQKPPTLAELVTSLKGLQDLTPNDKKGGDSMKDTLELLSVAKDLFATEPAAGGEGIISEITQAIKAAKDMGFLDDIKGKLAAINAAKAAQVARIPVDRPTPQIIGGPTVIKSPEPPQAPTAPVVESNPILDGLRPYVSIFQAKAENNVAPEQAAEFLVAELYENIIPLIKKHMTAAKFVSDETVAENLVGRAQDAEQVEFLFKFAPELESYREWVSEVIRLAIVSMTQEPQNVEA